MTREFLEGLGLNQEQIEKIIADHGKTIQKKQTEFDAYKAEQQKKINQWEQWKAAEATKATKEKKENAVIAHLTGDNAKPEAAKLLLKAFDLDELELLPDGRIADWETKSQGIKAEYSGFFGAVTTKGADTATPPQNNYQKPKDPFAEGFDEE